MLQAHLRAAAATAMSLALLTGCGGAGAGSGARERIVVYSFTSRIAAVEREFERRHPNLDVIAVDLSSTKQIARLVTEQDAGQFTVDVLYLGDAPVVAGKLLPEGRLVSYVPERLQARLAPEHRSPLLAQRLSTKVVLYNAAAHPHAPPIRNLWELTQPQWRRKVILVDPTQRGDYLDFFSEIVLRPQEMADAYRALYGEPLRIDADSSNAGEQFIRALFANDPVLVSNTAAVNNAIGGAGARNAMIGIGTYSDVRDNLRQGWALQVAADLEPAAGIVYPVYLAVARHSPNPAGARHLIDFMMGDDSPNGGPAYAPFHVPGDYATRRDLRAHEDALPLADLQVWAIDPARTAAIRERVADFILSL
jgi:iron(III) transport system substrate-binding protein